jgi:hypothetical protein
VEGVVVPDSQILQILPRFSQKLIPGINVEGVVNIGIDVAKTGMQVSGKAFEKTVTLGGQEVTVRAVLNSNNAIRSVFPVQ